MSDDNVVPFPKMLPYPSTFSEDLREARHETAIPAVQVSICWLRRADGRIAPVVWEAEHGDGAGEQLCQAVADALRSELLEGESLEVTTVEIPAP